MIFLGVLCLAAYALAQPAVYVSRTTFDDAYPIPYYYPLDAPLVALAPEKEGVEDEKEIIIPGIPDAPYLSPYTLIKTIIVDPTEEAAEELKSPEDGIEANKEEEPKEEVIEEEVKEEEENEVTKVEEAKEAEPQPEPAEESHVPVVVRIKPPGTLSTLFSSLPISLPQINFPFLGSIFGKPKLEPMVLPSSEPIQMVRYRVNYVPVLPEPLELAKK